MTVSHLPVITVHSVLTSSLAITVAVQLVFTAFTANSEVSTNPTAAPSIAPSTCIIRITIILQT